ncbi:hypothetical protein QP741_23340, partial [Bacillus subtilis]|nr:hypothetical protein [Bacillus subtilis]
MKKDTFLIIIFLSLIAFILGYSIDWFKEKEAKSFNSWVDPTQAPFNAKGDGKTDDTEAIQLAINYAHAHG